VCTFVEFYDKNSKRIPSDIDELKNTREFLRDMGTTPQEIIEKIDNGVEVFAVKVSPSGDLKQQAKTCS
jgi:hypothetical protein